MTSNEIFLTIILVIGWLTAVVIAFQCSRWRNKHDEAVHSWLIESCNKDEQILKLQEELKDMERVVKFESVVSQPIELECKFQVQEELIDHTDLFKRLCVSEAARYLAEEIERQPTLYRLIFEKNPTICCENVRMRFRLLPYPEGAIWDIKEKDAFNVIPGVTHRLYL